MADTEVGRRGPRTLRSVECVLTTLAQGFVGILVQPASAPVAADSGAYMAFLRLAFKVADIRNVPHAIHPPSEHYLSALETTL
jgi:hypothetical protein